MTRTKELLKKARKKSGIVNGFLPNKDLEGKQHENVNNFRENNKVSKLMTKLKAQAFKNIGSFAMDEKASPQKLIEMIEQHQKAIQQRLKGMESR